MGAPERRHGHQPAPPPVLELPQLPLAERADGPFVFLGFDIGKFGFHSLNGLSVQGTVIHRQRPDHYKAGPALELPRRETGLRAVPQQQLPTRPVCTPTMNWTGYRRRTVSLKDAQDNPHPSGGAPAGIGLTILLWSHVTNWAERPFRLRRTLST